MSRSDGSEFRVSTEGHDAPIVKDLAYYARLRESVGRGAPTLLIGTSTRSLKRSLERLKAAQREAAAAPTKINIELHPQVQRGVARLLRPEAEVVPFLPRGELTQLISWATDNRQVSVQLVIGPAGAGKTRLALQLADQVSKQGWQPLWLAAGAENEAVQVARGTNKPMLLIVDYAETRVDLATLLATLTIVADDLSAPGIKLILLARSAGEWWQQLIASVPSAANELLTTVEPISLGPLPEGPRRLAFETALLAFASALDIQPPRAELVLTSPDAVMLVVHAAALLAVLDQEFSSHDEADAVAESDTLDHLLRHEARYWQRSLAARGLDLNLAIARQAVAVGYLIGADDESSAINLLSAIPDLATSRELRGRAARWLHDLYRTSPVVGPRPEWIGKLTPDFIAERLVVTVLSEQPRLISSLFTGLSERRSAWALTVLARAALTYPEAKGQLELALRSDPENQVVPALAVAIATNGALAGLIGNVLASSALSHGALTRVASAIPYPSVTLSETAAIVFERLAVASKDDVSQHSRWLVDLSAWQSLLGRQEDALAAAEEAVAIRRSLAAARPDAFLPDLAQSLNNQANFLSELGRREEALAAAEEAVAIRRSLAAARPDAFLPDLALSLSNQANRQADLRREEAVTPSEEAVTIRRDLTEAHPDVFLLGPAGSLNNLAGAVAAVLREADAALVEAAYPRQADRP
jgi:tetratricopeptide (TPR) repeat protein